MKRVIKIYNSMKKTYSLLSFCVLLCVIGCTKKKPPIASGTAGELTWIISADGTLTISGTGAMPNYRTPSWYEYRDKITIVIIDNKVSSICNNAFSGCTGLMSVTIPNSVKSIGNSVFPQCTALTSVTIPNSVISIGDWAFFGCTGLTEIINQREIPQTISNVFNYVTKTECTLFVPAASIETYRVADGWKDFENIMAI